MWHLVVGVTRAIRVSRRGACKMTASSDTRRDGRRPLSDDGALADCCVLACSLALARARLPAARVTVEGCVELASVPQRADVAVLAAVDARCAPPAPAAFLEACRFFFEWAAPKSPPPLLCDTKGELISSSGSRRGCRVSFANVFCN